MIAVTHFNDVRPSGAEAAIDAALGGGISERATALRGRFGTPWFLPTPTSPLATGCVAVILLGDAERFSSKRLEEVGRAIADAAAAIGARDVATVLHGAGGLKVDPEEAARRLVAGVLDGVADARTHPPLRELLIVEKNPEQLAAVRSGVGLARGPAGVHVYVTEDALPERRGATLPSVGGAIPHHLRMGLTRSGSKLKVTLIGSESYNCATELEYPAEQADNVSSTLAKVLAETDQDEREQRLKSLGAKLHAAFVEAVHEFPVDPQIDEAPEHLLVLALDQATVNLPWELMYRNESFLSTTHALGRQVELPYLGRQSAYAEPRDLLEVLVVGNPTVDLPEAGEEAGRVAQLLRSHGATVSELVGDGRRPIRLDDVCEALDLHNFDVLHYAGHATYDALREGQSGLQLADGTLTADDLATRRWVPRVVVLNACHAAQTGPSGDGSVFQGSRQTRDMVQQLLGAGTRAFIGAMWKVADEPAAHFAQALYGSLLGGGPGATGRIGEAVRHARSEVAAKHGWGEGSWAAYALYGNPWQRAL